MSADAFALATARAERDHSYTRVRHLEDELAEVEAKVRALQAFIDRTNGGRSLAALTRDADRWHAVGRAMVYGHSGPHYGWTLDEFLPGDDPDDAADRLIRESRRPREYEEGR